MTLCLWKYPYFCIPEVLMTTIAAVGKTTMHLGNKVDNTYNFASSKCHEFISDEFQCKQISFLLTLMCTGPGPRDSVQAVATNLKGTLTMPPAITAPHSEAGAIILSYLIS